MSEFYTPPTTSPAQLHAERRERIATAALQGIIAAIGDNTAIDPDGDVISAKISVASVRLADSLIAELDKSKESHE